MDRIFLEFHKSPPPIFGKCSEKNSGGQNVLLYHTVSVETIKSVFYRGNRSSSGVDPSFNPLTTGGVFEKIDFGLNQSYMSSLSPYQRVSKDLF